MELFGSTTSPFVRHCRIALEQAQIPYELKLIDYDTSAKESPLQKMPYLKDGKVFLTDSSSILMHIRKKQGQAFPASVEDFELYTMVNTLADTAVNLFLMEKDGITPEKSDYLTRQQARLKTGFETLNSMIKTTEVLSSDGIIRAACLLDWILFRNRYDLSSYGQLISLVSHAAGNELFIKTDPRA